MTAKINDWGIHNGPGWEDSIPEAVNKMYQKYNSVERTVGLNLDGPNFPEKIGRCRHRLARLFADYYCPSEVQSREENKNYIGLYISNLMGQYITALEAYNAIVL